MKRLDTINVIPLIDIMLVMLAIVLTTATFINYGNIEIDLPAATTITNATQKSAYNIAIDRNEALFLDDQPVDLDALNNALAELDGRASIALRVDQQASFGAFTAVIDALKTHRLHRLSIMVKPDAQ